MNPIDAALKSNDDGDYDLKIAENGDLETVDGFETSILLSLFSNSRASASEVQESNLRGGWWGNTTRVDEHQDGSLLWLLDQARLTAQTLVRATRYANDCLQWMVEDKAAVSVEAQALSGAQNGIDSLVAIRVTINRSQGAVERRYYDLWEATEVTNAN